jgi:hypothetical protein
MIPPVVNPVWRRIATGQISIPSSKLAVNLLTTNVRVRYTNDPTEANVQALILRVHEFFARFENIFSEELKAILKS